MITWMRRNLFRSITDTILTVISASTLGYVIFQVFQFVFITGRWEIIQVNLKILLVGRFPEELMFLVGFSILATCFSIASLASGMNRPLDQPPTLAGKLWELFQRFGLIISTSAFLIVLAGDLGRRSVRCIRGAFDLRRNTLRKSQANYPSEKTSRVVVGSNKCHAASSSNFLDNGAGRARRVGRVPDQFLPCRS